MEMVTTLPIWERHSESGRLGASIVSGASARWLLHDNVAGVFQMPNDAIGGYPGHERIDVMDTLSAAKPESERDRVGKVLGIGGVSFSSSGIRGQ